jgi:hypothetical protein
LDDPFIRIPALLAKFVPARDVLTVVFVSALDGVIEVSCGGPDITGDVVGTMVVVVAVVVVSASTPAGTSKSRENRQTKRENRFIPGLLHQLL